MKLIHIAEFQNELFKGRFYRTYLRFYCKTPKYLKYKKCNTQSFQVWSLSFVSPLFNSTSRIDFAKNPK